MTDLYLSAGCIVDPTVKLKPFDSVMHLVQGTVGAGDNEYRIKEKLPCLSQGKWNSCVAFSCLSGMEMLLDLDEYLSKMFPYFTFRFAMGTDSYDSGSIVHIAFEQLVNVGTVYEVDYPYIDANLTNQPDPSLMVQASNIRLKDYFVIDKDVVNQTEASIRSNHPVFIATGVSRKDVTGWKVGMPALQPPVATDVNHGMLLTGVRKNLDGTRDFYVRNSWGTSYGEAGHFWISEHYLTWVGTLSLNVLSNIL